MPARKRERIEPTDDWAQLQLRLDWPEHTRYELIRPVVVFGHAPADRAKLTGRSTSTIYLAGLRPVDLGPDGSGPTLSTKRESCGPTWGTASSGGGRLARSYRPSIGRCWATTSGVSVTWLVPDGVGGGVITRAPIRWFRRRGSPASSA